MEITADIGLQSNTSCELRLSSKPSVGNSADYIIIELEISTAVNSNSSFNVSVETIEDSSVQVGSIYQLYGTIITAEINNYSEIIPDVFKINKPGYSAAVDYELYTLKITAEISLESILSTDPGEILKPGSSAGGVYYLEDYPEYIKMRIGTEVVGTLRTTYIADNESLIVLDPELNLLTYLDDIEYFSWTRRWRRPDSFELKINRYKDNAKQLKVNNYLIKKKGDVLRGGRIRDRKIEVDQEGKITEVWKVKGRGFGDIFNQRIALNDIEVGDGYDTVEVPAETAMKYFVQVNAVSPDDGNRIIPNLKIEEDKEMGKVVKYKARFQKLSEILYDISRVSGLGWDIKFDIDKKEFVFQVLYAELKPEIKLSTETDSVQRINFKEKHLDSVNTAVIAGQGEGSDRMIVKVTEDDL